MKKVETHSICFPTEVYKQIHELSDNLHISDSAVVTAMVSCVLKWDIKEVFEHGIQGRRA
jgi:hypothetical protein